MYLLEKMNKQKPSVLTINNGNELIDVPPLSESAKCNKDYQPSFPSSSTLSSTTPTSQLSDHDILRTAQERQLQYRQHNIEIETILQPKSLLLVKVYNIDFIYLLIL